MPESPKSKNRACLKAPKTLFGSSSVYYGSFWKTDILHFRRFTSVISQFWFAFGHILVIVLWRILDFHNVDEGLASFTRENHLARFITPFIDTFRHNWFIAVLRFLSQTKAKVLKECSLPLRILVAQQNLQYWYVFILLTLQEIFTT